MPLNRFVIPVILLIASIGLFFGFISKGFKERNDLREGVAVYEDAIEKAKQLKAKQDELDKKRLSIGAANLESLERLLPDTVDTVRMIMNLNGIASNYNIPVRSIKVNEVKEKASSIPVAPGGVATAQIKSLSEYESVGLSFSVVTTYEKFEAFLRDLEESLQVLDITQISLKPAESSSAYDFSVTAVTYWLK